MEYLSHQCGKTFDQQFVTSNIDELIDDSGFEDEEIDQLGIFDEKDSQRVIYITKTRIDFRRFFKVGE